MPEDASGPEAGFTGRRALAGLTKRLGERENATHRGEILAAIHAALDAARKEAAPGPPTPEQAAQIQGWIDELEVEHPGAYPARICKEEMNALPIHGDILYIWALRPDGVILSLDHEAFNLAREVETNPLIQFGAMVHGAEQYPELWRLIPAPPPHVRPCDECDGNGYPLNYDDAHSYCFTCNGLGWVDWVAAD